MEKFAQFVPNPEIESKTKRGVVAFQSRGPFRLRGVGGPRGPITLEGVASLGDCTP